MSALFGILAGKNQLFFFLVAWKFELNNNYRNSPKKLVSNEKKVPFLKAEKVVLSTEKKLRPLFFIEILGIFNKNLEEEKTVQQLLKSE